MANVIFCRRIFFLAHNLRLNAIPQHGHRSGWFIAERSSQSSTPQTDRGGGGRRREKGMGVGGATMVMTSYLNVQPFRSPPSNPSRRRLSDNSGNDKQPMTPNVALQCAAIDTHKRTENKQKT